ncbi:MAG: DUF3842 family protein [Rectinema subterraneum]|uniref:DUF3842 family protein n=1 Tax=Rectinema subterraneum TaxID=2653714 RepID=UPI003C7CC317
MEKKPIIVVVDGLGGGIGSQLCAQVRQAFGHDVEILALGTNASATEQMIKAGADRGASGENAIRVSINLGQIVLGPIGIVLPDAMMGEITPKIARAVMHASGKKILLPVNQPHFILAGLPPSSLSRCIEEAVGLVASELGLAVH